MSILEHVEPLPPDPIFGLGEIVKKDPRKDKVDLVVGIYRDENLQTETMRAVKQAEKRLLESEKNKTYLPMRGNAAFIQASRELVFGREFSMQEAGRFMGLQTIGGTNALWIGGKVLAQEVSKNLYFSDPTWANHRAIFQAGGLNVKKYPYYNEETRKIDFEGMRNFLAKAPEKSVVLLHACCHNPTGCDFTKDQWKELSVFMLKHKLIPFFDFAYQGFAQGIQEDAWAIRHFAEKGHELFVAHSFSKFFGLYGERVGALHVLVKNQEVAENAQGTLTQVIRQSFSNPPRHGASLVSIVWNDDELRQMWEDELTTMRKRIEKMRTELTDALDPQFSFLKNRNGMFSMLGLKSEVVDQLNQKYGIYLTRSGRVNLTGLNSKNIPYVAAAITDTIS